MYRLTYLRINSHPKTAPNGITREKLAYIMAPWVSNSSSTSNTMREFNTRLGCTFWLFFARNFAVYRVYLENGVDKITGIQRPAVRSLLVTVVSSGFITRVIFLVVCVQIILQRPANRHFVNDVVSTHPHQ